MANVPFFAELKKRASDSRAFDNPILNSSSDAHENQRDGSDRVNR